MLRCCSHKPARLAVENFSFQFGAKYLDLLNASKRPCNFRVHQLWLSSKAKTTSSSCHRIVCNELLSQTTIRRSCNSALIHRSFHASLVRMAEEVDVYGPAFAESITEGDIRWSKKVGDYIQADEVVAQIETDKTMVDVPAPQAGTIVTLLVDEGSKVTAKQKLFVMKVGEAPAGDAPSSSSKPEPKATPAQPSSPSRESSPSFQQPMRTTPVTPFKPAPARAPQPSISASSTPSSPPQPHVSAEKAITGARTETRVKMNRMRQRIAHRLKDAQNTYAMLTTFNEIDMSNILALRAKYKDAFAKKHGVKLGIMSPFIKAAAYALLDQPVVNAVIDENDVIYRHYIDMSVAVATERGLVVPVLRNVEMLSYAGIERELAELGNKARDNKLAIEDMEGGTFTVSNGGVFGSLMGTPIINPPQSAILGIHATSERPVAVNGQVVIRPMMYVALTYDHRLIDGREAVTFLRKIKQAVEDPASILLEL